MKQKVVIFGAGLHARLLVEHIEVEYDIVCFIDSNKRLEGSFINDKYEIKALDKIKELHFDKIIIGTIAFASEMLNELLKRGIPREKIIYKFNSNKIPAYIFPVNELGPRVYEQIKDSYDFKGYLSKKESDKKDNVFMLDDIGDELKNAVVFIISHYTIEDSIHYLLSAGVKPYNIKTIYSDLFNNARKTFLKTLSRDFERDNIDGDIAEAGVFQGDLAEEINRDFANKKFYMFDTFEGFPSKDVELEHDLNFSNTSVGLLNNTSVDFVMSKMKYPENCIIRKGYFPKTAEGLESNKFCFVSVDMDMYEPTLNALKFFYPRMVKGGVILIHDYYSNYWTGVKNAVTDYEVDEGVDLVKMPIGDMWSVAIIKK